MESVKVGLIGLGTVGTGVAKVLTENSGVISDRLGCPVELAKAADKDTERDRGITLPEGALTPDAGEVLNDPEIDIVVELVGGTTVAKDFVLQALECGKHVVTANKALLSTHGREIFSKAASKGLSVGYEASVGGGIPVIKSVREGLAANNIELVYGILNGTANYILSEMTTRGGRFEDVLKKAQELGYAEADPTYDVEGIDTAHKLAILIDLAYGTYVDLDDIYTEGISRITELDIRFAQEFGYTIKLLAIAKKTPEGVEARVHPTMVPSDHPLAGVDGAYNAVHMRGDAVGDVMLYGLGAGMMPTASAVVGDVVDIARDLKSGVASRVNPLSYTPEAMREVRIKPMAELELAYYIRFQATDKPGVLSRIAGILGEHGISISSVIQKGRKIGGGVPVVVTTHHAPESGLAAAAGKIEELDTILDKPVYIRIEEKLGAD